MGGEGEGVKKRKKQTRGKQTAVEEYLLEDSVTKVLCLVVFQILCVFQ